MRMEIDNSAEAVLSILLYRLNDAQCSVLSDDEFTLVFSHGLMGPSLKCLAERLRDHGRLTHSDAGFSLHEVVCRDSMVLGLVSREFAERFWQLIEVYGIDESSESLIEEESDLQSFSEFVIEICEV